MSEYTEVELPFLQQLAAQGWTVIDQGCGVPQDAAGSLRDNFRQWLQWVASPLATHFSFGPPFNQRGQSNR